jgi:hypothetical protein
MLLKQPEVEVVLRYRATDDQVPSVVGDCSAKPDTVSIG